jgi:hypothetical protein
MNSGFSISKKWFEHCLNVKPPNYGRKDSPKQEESDNCEGMVSEIEAVPRRSGRVTQAPMKPIEEISGISKNKAEAGWKEFCQRHS